MSVGAVIQTAYAVDDRELVRANSLFQRLTGTRLAASDPVLTQMAELIAANRATEAAAIATARPGFVNHVLFQMASEMSDADNSPRSVRRLYESAARIMLVVKKDQDISTILTDQTQFPRIVASQCTADADPFRCSTARRLDLSSDAVLDFGSVRQLPIWLVVGGSTVDVTGALPNGNMDMAGIFTDRGFGNVAYEAGTNRRGWQKFVMQFFGLSLHDLRSQTPSDRFVRGDVSRNPEGTGSELYVNQCKTCHSTIDALTRAFAHFDTDAGEHRALIYQDNGATYKYFRNVNNYPAGFVANTNDWQALYTPTQLASLGWPLNQTQGQGVHSLAVALSQTKQFYRGLVKAVMSYVCPNLDPTDSRTAVLKTQTVERLATELQSHQKLKRTFETVAARPECLGPK